MVQCHYSLVSTGLLNFFCVISEKTPPDADENDAFMSPKGIRRLPDYTALSISIASTQPIHYF